MSKKVDQRIPNTVGQGQLPAHPAIKTPWEKLISLYDANYYICRHRAGVAAVYIEVLRTLIPDYEERCQRMCEVVGNTYSYVFSPDGMDMSHHMLKREIFHPFMRGTFLAGPNGDAGDESLWMCGRVNDFGTHRIEKELDTCPWELTGSELCRTSTWAGMECIGNQLSEANGGGPRMRITMYEAKGCGDLHCRIVGESYEKYPMPERAIWDNFGPIATEELIKFTPEEKCIENCQIYREECGYKFRSGTCFEYDAADTGGNGFEMSSSITCGVDYCSYVFEDMIAKGEVTREYVNTLLENTFEACGKMMFLDPWAIEGVRSWMGVPRHINDGRVIGAYIEIYLQALKCPYDIVAFNSEEVIYDIDENRFNLYIPSMKVAYIPMWFGMCKSLVNYQWALWEETGDVPEGKFRIKIAKKIDKRSR